MVPRGQERTPITENNRGETLLTGGTCIGLEKPESGNNAAENIQSAERSTLVDSRLTLSDFHEIGRDTSQGNVV